MSFDPWCRCRNMIVCNPLRNSLSLVGAQREEMLIFVFLILTLWIWLDFGVRCVGISTLQSVRKLQKKCPFCPHSHSYMTPCPFRVPQRREVCDPLISCVWHVNVGWLSTNNPTWLQRVSSNICYFLDLLSLLISFLWCATLLCRCSVRESDHFQHSTNKH